MAAEKTLAIVLRVIEFSETSCVVTLYTREFGKITGLAKGARRKKSPFESALDVLALVRLVFLRKTPPAMDLLTEAKLERRFRAGAADLGRLYAAYYVIELLLVLTEGGESQPELYDLAEETIRLLDDGGTNPSAILAAFELGLLQILGHQPMLTACVDCGRQVPEQATRFSFCSVSGGIVCTRCRSGKTGVLSLSREARDWMLGQLESEHAPAHRVLELSPRGRVEVRQVLNHFENSLVGYRLPVQEFLS
ncbi:MAG: DNA repair protein RecO [Planctomycetota bacterium]|jgi:DNA repair protein RecO (recombination protein O)